MERGLTVPLTRNAQRLDEALSAQGHLMDLAAAHRRVKEGPSVDIQRLLDDPDLMAGLSGRRRQAVELRFRDGLTNKETAARLGLTYAGFRSAIKEAVAWSASQAGKATQVVRATDRRTSPVAMPVLIRREVVKNRAYAALDLDRPGSAALAVAWKTDDGWSVGVDGGRVVGAKLPKQQALNLMHRAANDRINRSVARRILAEAAA
jgi:hypothetical protein